ncbi:MAG TPA: quinone oxidoreductase [Beijerinckia sp.]|jgi:NADPH2:quinone reductase|nr:quinone oxidoreductase [Beijerinckia sp.]
MAKRMELKAIGGTEGFDLVDFEPSPPGADEILIAQEAIGLNFVDIYQRKGLYPLPEFPAVLGVEAAGTIAAVGAGVSGLTIGDRVAYAGLPAGAYTSHRILPAARAIKLPDFVSVEEAAASMLRGLTTYMLLDRVYRVEEGTTLLVHSAAGGVGTLTTRWAKKRGACVVGTVGSKEKRQRAEANGADHVIVLSDGDFVKEVLAFTQGKGVDMVIDGIGGDVPLRSIACLRSLGVLASIGMAAGPATPIPLAAIPPMKAITLARPSVLAYVQDEAAYRRGADEVFAMIEAGVKPAIGATYKLANVATAQSDLEAGRTIGSLLLVP